MLRTTREKSLPYQVKTKTEVISEFTCTFYLPIIRHSIFLAPQWHSSTYLYWWFLSHIIFLIILLVVLSHWWFYQIVIIVVFIITNICDNMKWPISVTSIANNEYSPINTINNPCIHGIRVMTRFSYPQRFSSVIYSMLINCWKKSLKIIKKLKKMCTKIESVRKSSHYPRLCLL